MRVPAATILLIVTAFCGVPGPSFGGGFEKPPGGYSFAYGEQKFVPLRLPLSAKAARTWISLRETLVTPPPDATPFKDVLRFIRESTRGKDGKGEPLGVYLDAVTMQEAELTMETPVAAPFLLGQSKVPLHTYLKFFLKPLGLTHSVHDGLVVIDSPCDDCPEPVEISAEYAWAWLLLHEEIPLHFPKGTTLGDALQTIQRATVGKRPGGRGLAIYLDPNGLRAAEKSPASPATFEIDRAPLCTSLGLLLKTEGLVFAVGDDGLVTVTDNNGLNEFKDEAEVVESYELLRFDIFWQMEQSDREDERRRASKVQEPCSRGGGKD